jgi:phosphoglycolate phosphatase
LFPKVSPEGRNTLVFDLDGTLVDSAPDIASAMNEVLAEAGRRALTLELIRGMVGDGTSALVSRAFAAADGGVAPEPSAIAGQVERFRKVYEARATEETRLYPGVLETIQGLHTAGYRMGLCTNKPDRPARAILEAFGLSPFIRTVVGGETAPVRKPDPRHLAAVLGQLDAKPREAVMVGDGMNDIMAARALSVPVVLAAFGFSRIAEGVAADAVIERFDRLTEVLAGLAPAESEAVQD